MGGVAVVTEAADTRASAGDMVAVSAAASVRVELLVATVEPGLAGPAATMARGIIHPESQRDATAATADMAKSTPHREARLEGRFTVPARDRKVELLPSSLLGRHAIPVAITFRKIDPGLVLRVSPLSSPRDYSGTSRDIRQQRAGTTAKGATRPDRTWSRQNAANRQRLDPQTTQRLRNWQGKAPGYGDAKRHHQEHWQDRKHHDHDWWRHHCDAIVFVGGGFWGWYDGWWYPAWGYDPYYSYYDYNGPIYGYDGLQPDEVIADVQAALQQLGYYAYAVDGVLGPATEAAITNYQRDYGLPVTGAIDPPTVRSLGLNI